MNTEFQKLITDFQEKVEEANNLLKKYLNTDEPHNRHPVIKQSGLLGGKYKYYFHGVGCVVHISKKDVIDFDYGANGRIDGFDEWRLCCFIDHRKQQYPHIQKNDIKVWFQEAIVSNEIAKLESSKYDDLYYLMKS